MNIMDRDIDKQMKIAATLTLGGGLLALIGLLSVAAWALVVSLA